MQRIKGILEEYKESTGLIPLSFDFGWHAELYPNGTEIIEMEPLVAKGGTGTNRRSNCQSRASGARPRPRTGPPAELDGGQPRPEAPWPAAGKQEQSAGCGETTRCGERDVTVT